MLIAFAGANEKPRFRMESGAVWVAMQANACARQ